MPAALPSSAPRSSPSSNPSDNPFEAAQKARVEGRLAEAARLFDDVRRKHRADPHAALAAFELGRLRLDALGDPAGAAEAFSDALVLGPGSALAEDAAARRVEALGRQGDHDRCAAARDAYLRQYPSGVYARAMVRFCK
jgi:transmembrane sensor